MAPFRASTYAKKIKKDNPKIKQATVIVCENDYCLVIQVYDGNLESYLNGDCEMVNEHDTGLDGDTVSPETEQLAVQIVAELINQGIKAIKYDVNNIPEPDA